MLSSCFTFLPSSYMMHAPKQTMALSSLHTDQSSAHDYVKPKREFGSPSLMTSYKLTLNISSKPPPRNPPGRPGASEPFTNPSLAAGVSHSELYKKTAARHPHKRLLTNHTTRKRHPLHSRCQIQTLLQQTPNSQNYSQSRLQSHQTAQASLSPRVLQGTQHSHRRLT